MKANYSLAKLHRRTDSLPWKRAANTDGNDLAQAANTETKTLTKPKLGQYFDQIKNLYVAPLKLYPTLEARDKKNNFLSNSGTCLSVH